MDGHGGIAGLCIYVSWMNGMELLLMESRSHPMGSYYYVAKPQTP
jgi:hypothetical protein